MRDPPADHAALLACIGSMPKRSSKNEDVNETAFRILAESIGHAKEPERDAGQCGGGCPRETGRTEGRAGPRREAERSEAEGDRSEGSSGKLGEAVAMPDSLLCILLLDRLGPKE